MKNSDLPSTLMASLHRGPVVWRDRILETLGDGEEHTVSAVCLACAATTKKRVMAVKDALDELAAEGRVACRIRREGAGRPAVVVRQVTPAGD